MCGGGFIVDNKDAGDIAPRVHFAGSSVDVNIGNGNSMFPYGFSSARFGSTAHTGSFQHIRRESALACAQEKSEGQAVTMLLNRA